MNFTTLCPPYQIYHIAGNHVLNGLLYRPSLAGRLKFSTNGISDSIDAVFVITLNYADDPAFV